MHKRLTQGWILEVIGDCPNRLLLVGVEDFEALGDIFSQSETVLKNIVFTISRIR